MVQRFSCYTARNIPRIEKIKMVLEDKRNPTKESPQGTFQKRRDIPAFANVSFLELGRYGYMIQYSMVVLLQTFFLSKASVHFELYHEVVV